jgi:hypothetical protein
MGEGVGQVKLMPRTVVGMVAVCIYRVMCSLEAELVRGERYPLQGCCW